MTQKHALVTGITGQDGAYLSELLLDKGYRVTGYQQLSATPNTQNIHHLIDHPSFTLVQGDMVDATHLQTLIAQNNYDEVYNLAGQSHVGQSFATPDYTAQVNGMAVVRILEAIKNFSHSTKFYQAGSSEIFGNAKTERQNEETPLNPCSPYAAAKAYAHHMVRIYRETYNIFACNGILFNHESPIRGEDFVTQKIASAVKENAPLALGNLDAQRDWGHARDYVRGMWMMMQQDTADDYVLATGQSVSVREFATRAYAKIGITIGWQGTGVNEIGIDSHSGKTMMTIDPTLYRPNELHTLCGDATKARDILGWQPALSLNHLIDEMVPTSEQINAKVA